MLKAISCVSKRKASLNIIERIANEHRAEVDLMFESRFQILARSKCYTNFRIVPEEYKDNTKNKFNIYEVVWVSQKSLEDSCGMQMITSKNAFKLWRNMCVMLEVFSERYGYDCLKIFHDIISAKTWNISHQIYDKIMSVFSVFNRLWLMTG